MSSASSGCGKLQHPNGRWEMNELHIPVGKAVKLTMISEDVIHDFFIPAFRAKMDVVPGRYTHMWFKPIKAGRYHIFCSQFCGTNHAIMGGYVTVMEPADYEKWAQTGNQPASLASAGERKFRELGLHRLSRRKRHRARAEPGGDLQQSGRDCQRSRPDRDDQSR